MTEFEPLTGEWWILTDPSDRVPGTLTYKNGEGGRLNLTASFGSQIEMREYDVIYGLTPKGPATLSDCFDLQLSRFEDRTNREILANRVVVGVHLPDEDGPHLRAAGTQIRHLYRWFDVSGLEIDHGESPVNETIKYRRPDPVVVTLTDGRVTFHFLTENAFHHADRDGRLTIQEKVHIEIEPDSPQSFVYFDSVVMAVSDFFSVATGTLCQVERLEVETRSARTLSDGAVVYPRGDVMVPSFSSTERAAPVPWEMLFRYEDVSSKFASMLASWIGKMRQLGPARSLYISSLYHQPVYIDAQFLSLVQAIESYHRQLMNDEYISESEFKSSVLAPLLVAIPANLPPRFRDALAGRLATGNSYSLLSRLETIVARHERTVRLFDTDIEDTIRRIVRMRNRMTHAAQRAEMSQEVTQLARDSQMMRLLLDLCFFHEMGLEPDAVHDIARKSHRYHRTFPSRKHRITRVGGE